MREKLLTIKGLKLSGILENMDDGSLLEYIQSLDAFVEDFSAQETALKDAFSAGNTEAFSLVLLSIRDCLLKIHAPDLAQSCLHLIDKTKDERKDVYEAYFNYVLTLISALSIDIQMATHKNAPKCDTSPRSAGSTEANHTKTILAVDDSPLSLNMMKSALLDSPYKFSGVISGSAALKFTEKNTPDLLILDIEMPEMDGYELARELRERGQTAPIIFLTGNSSKEYVLKAIQAGATDFITKPLNREGILDKINKYIGD